MHALPLLDDRPAAQSVQALSLVLPMPDDLPAVQSAHTSLPLPEKRPSAQFVHALLPLLLENCPATHAMQVLLPLLG